MPAITNVVLTISTDTALDRARVVVNCDVEFTQVEVNAMNILGLQYELSCRVLGRDALDDYPVVTFHTQVFPTVPGAALTSEHALFDTVGVMTDLHEHVFGKDQLVAELTLTNTETGTQNVRRGIWSTRMNGRVS